MRAEATDPGRRQLWGGRAQRWGAGEYTWRGSFWQEAGADSGASLHLGGPRQTAVSVCQLSLRPRVTLGSGGRVTLATLQVPLLALPPGCPQTLRRWHRLAGAALVTEVNGHSSPGCPLGFAVCRGLAPAWFPSE